MAQVQAAEYWCLKSKEDGKNEEVMIGNGTDGSKALALFTSEQLADACTESVGFRWASFQLKTYEQLQAAIAYLPNDVPVSERITQVVLNPNESLTVILTLKEFEHAIKGHH